MSPTLLKTLGSVLVTVLGALAVSNAFPPYTPVFSAVSGLVAGWLHLPVPGAKAAAKAEALDEAAK